VTGRVGSLAAVAWLAAAGGAAGWVGDAGAAEPSLPAFDAGTALAASQAAIGREVPDVELTGQDGVRFRLSRFRGRPLVISPIYTSCFHICPTTTAYLKGVVAIANDVVGQSAFTVLTIGFDTEHDTPEQMRAYGRARGVDGPQWVLASADEASARQLLDGIGFSYARAGGGFEHMVLATVVDASGRVYGQVYGQQFEAPLLVDSLKRIVAGQRAQEATLPALIDRVRLICTVFDPNSGRYHLDYSLFVAFGVGVLCLGAVAVFLWRSWRELPPRDRTA
jgi:protein SCO1/2